MKLNILENKADDKATHNAIMNAALIYVITKSSAGSTGQAHQQAAVQGLRERLRGLLN
jgi:hypothetical protein